MEGYGQGVIERETHHQQCPDGIVEEDDGSGHEHG